MNSESGKSGMDERKKFLLVQFTESQKKGILDMDVIPATWIFCDWETKECYTKYPPPPCTKKSCELLQARVQKEQPPFEKWPQWRVIVKGSAPTYNIAIHRLEELNTENYDYTTDAEEDQKKKVDSIVEKYRHRSVMDFLDVTSLQNDDDNGNNYVPSVEASWNSSDSSSTAERTGKWKFSKQDVNKSSRRTKSSKKGRYRKVSPTTSSSNEASPSDYVTIKQEAAEISDGSVQGVENLSTKAVLSDIAKQNMSAYFDEFEEHAKTEPTYSVDTMVFVSVMKRFSMDLRNNTAAINSLRDALVGKGSVDPRKATVETFKREYEVELPFTNLEDFQLFDLQLKNDQHCHDNLIASLRYLLDRSNNMTKSCTTIFRKFFIREVMANFTAKKRVEGKILLRATNFGECVMAALTNFHTHGDGTYVTSDEVLQCCGKAIANSKDWNGRRPAQPQPQP